MYRPGHQFLLGRTPPWVPAGNPAWAADFTAGRVWRGSNGGGGQLRSAASELTVSRASTRYVQNLDLSWSLVPTGLSGMVNSGAIVEEARTNLALWARDLTNAAWAKVTMTTTLTATGIDGIANSATTCTATGALSTVLQTIVHASSADTGSIFVKRRTGTGTIEFTADGVAYTDITASLSSSAWYRPTVTGTLVNPVIGLRITTSGDAVDVDFGQLEVGTFATSPIPTTTVAVTRAADVVKVTAPPVFGLAYSLFAQGTPQAVAGYATNQFIAQIDDGTVNNRLYLLRTATTSLAQFDQNTGGSGSGSGNNLSEWSQNVSGKLAGSTIAGTQQWAFNGASVGVGSAALPSGVNAIRIGANSASAVFWNGTISRIAVWASTALPVAELQRLTK